MVLSPAGTGSQPASELYSQSLGAEDFGAETDGWMELIICVHTWPCRHTLTVKMGFSLDVFFFSLNKESLHSMVPMMGRKVLADKKTVVFT